MTADYVTSSSDKVNPANNKTLVLLSLKKFK